MQIDGIFQAKTGPNSAENTCRFCADSSRAAGQPYPGNASRRSTIRRATSEPISLISAAKEKAVMNYRTPKPAGRSILPKCKWIFLTSIPKMPPEKGARASPVRQVLDKVAKNGQGWPKMDKAGQNWTAGGQLFQPFCGATNSQRGVKEKTPALFLAVLRG
jgi:hypothetical protein